MPTYGDLQEDIADSIDDVTGEYAPQVKRAILKAIRFCERTHYYFNSTRDITFPTVSGQEWYGKDDNAAIPSLVHIHAAYAEDSSGSNRCDLLRYYPETIEILAGNGSASGRPNCYAYFEQKIRLYPVPGDDVYTVRLQLEPYRLTALSSDADTNAWLSEAYDMIFERSKYHLAADTLKDVALAQASLLLFKEQEAIVAAETSKREGTGSIRPTEF